MENLPIPSGSTFANRFEIEALAGIGGMGSVYRARDLRSGDLVALKLLHASGAGMGEAERFTREAKLLAELRHPGIVAYVGHGEAPDGERFLAMQWLHGEDLASRLRRGPLSLAECVLLLDRVSEALAFAHRNGVIHRDLKPSNLFLPDGEIGRVKILDFGIARRVTSAQVPAVTQTGVIVGTPEYMAPEQARGRRDLSPAADLFSLGCILYECLCGKPPFVADHIAAVLIRILFDEPPPIEQRRADVPESLVSLLRKLLCKDPEQRMANAQALRSALAGFGDLHELGFPRSAAARATHERSALAAKEQALLSVVLAALPDEEVALGATLQSGELGLAGPEREDLLAALQALEVSAEFLASGALVVTIPTHQSATDQAMLAARAARLIKGQWQKAVVSLATGRGVISGRMAVGEVVAQAALLLKQSTEGVRSATSSGIYMDELSEKLLSGRCETTLRSGGVPHASEEVADASHALIGRPTPRIDLRTELKRHECLGGATL